MDLLKNHYEKIILSVVLLGLAVAAAYLPIEVSNVQRTLVDETRDIDQVRVDPLPDPNVSTNELALLRIRNPDPVQIAVRGHNVFNPGRWIRAQDGSPVPEEAFGVQQLVLTAIDPLYTRIEYLGVRETGNVIRYQLRITRESSPLRSDQTPKLRFMVPGEKDSDRNTLCVLREVQGPPDQPTALRVELVEEGRTITLSEENPVYQEVTGYIVDLRHPTTNRNFNRQRLDSRISVSGETHKIVAISPDDVTLENVETLKRTTIRRHAPR